MRGRWWWRLGGGVAAMLAVLGSIAIEKAGSGGLRWPWLVAALAIALGVAAIEMTLTKTVKGDDERAQTAEPGRPFGLPPVPAEFVGREDELSILSGILRPKGSTAVTVISGTAGGGKTTLAVQAAHQAKSRFTGGNIFLDLQGFGTNSVGATEPLVVILRALGVRDEHVPEEPAAQLALYRSLLRPDRPTLVVLDNARRADQVEALLPGPPHHALITSRYSFADLPGARLIDLDVMTVEDSVALINNAVQIRRPGDRRLTDEPVAAHELAVLCGRLPLALAMVGARLAQDPGRPASDLVVSLRESSTRLDQLCFGEGTGVRPAFDVSFARLTADEQRLFRLLSLTPSSVFSAEAVAALADLPAHNTRQLLDALCRSHMVTPSEPHGRFRLHDLLKSYAVTLMSPDETFVDAYHRICRHYLCTAAAASVVVLSTIDDDVMARFPQCQVAVDWLESMGGNTSRFGDAQAAVDWIRTERDSLVNTALGAYDVGLHHTAPLLALLLLPYALAWGDWTLGMDLGRPALRSAEATGDFDQQLTILVWLKVVVAFRSADGLVREILLGRPRDANAGLDRKPAIASNAESLDEQLARVRELGLRHDEAACLLELAHAHWLARDYQGMRRRALEAVAVLQQLDLRLFLAQAHSLAAVAQAALHHPDRARTHLNEAMDGFEEFRDDELINAVRQRMDSLDVATKSTWRWLRRWLRRWRWRMAQLSTNDRHCSSKSSEAA